MTLHKSDYDSLGTKGQSKEDPSDSRNMTEDVSDEEYEKEFPGCPGKESSHLCCYRHCGVRAQFVALCKVT